MRIFHQESSGSAEHKEWVGVSLWLEQGQRDVAVQRGCYKRIPSEVREGWDHKGP